MKKVILTEEQALQILDYLMSKPWKEANPLITLLNNCCVDIKDGGQNGNV